MRLFYSVNRNNNHFILEADEFRHSIKVLRQRAGDAIHIIDGSGIIYNCIIESIGKQNLTAKIITREEGSNLPYQLTIAIAPTKNSNRFEWFVEKAVEIGIHEIIPIICSRSEKPKINLDRLEKICISAMKQSKNTRRPIISSPIGFESFLMKDHNDHQKCIAYVMEKTTNLSHTLDARDIMVAIGPEGGFSDDELSKAIDAGYMPVSLGKSRLRTETAGVATCQIVKTVFEFKKK